MKRPLTSSLSISTALLLLITGTCSNAQEEEPSTPEETSSSNEEKWSYALGRQQGERIMQSLGSSSRELERDSFLAGLVDAMDKNPSAFSIDELDTARLALRNQVYEREKQLAEENLEAAENFLTELREHPGILSTDSGLLYKVVKHGVGERYDGASGTQFLVRYRATVQDGTEFDSTSNSSPIKLDLNVVPGFREALTMMQVGAQWKIYVKPSLGYGAGRRSSIVGPNELLIFEVSLDGIESP